MLRNLQHALRDAILDHRVNGELSDLASVRVSQIDRFSIYRGNFSGSLRGVLRAAYPVTSRIVGSDLFDEASSRFALANPPTEPSLSGYGAGFADFLKSVPGARPLPYLSDVARLEWARIEAYFAADAKPLTGECLRGIDDEAAASLVFDPHPSCRFVQSNYPIHRIWLVNQPQCESVPAMDFSKGESVVVVRPGADVEMHSLGAEELKITQSLLSGRSLGTIVAEQSANTAKQFQSVLAATLSRGLISSYRFA